MATWKITNYVAAPDTGAIIRISWQCLNVRENSGCVITGEADLQADPTDPSFIPLNNVSMDTMVGFLKTALGDGATAYEQQADAMFDTPTLES